MDPSLSTSSSKRKLLKVFVVIAVITLILDFSAGKVLSGFQKGLDRGEFGTINKIIDGEAEDVYIFGSSRAKYHYNSRVIEKVSGMSTYNAGFNGRGILLSSTLIKILLQKKTPKVIILDINFLNKEFEEELSRLDILRPYYFEYPEVQELLNGFSFFEPLKYLSRSYPYNATVPAIIEKEIDKEGPDQNKGFLHLKGSVLKPDGEYEKRTSKDVNNRLMESLLSVCETAKEKGVRLIVCISPSLVRFRESEIAKVQVALGKQGIEFIDFSGIESYQSRKLFYNEDHLNSKGADFFSAKIAELIK
ncbi:MAG: hypothetical protein NE327_05580 [Lentisphaeraceae bacterium]|nr:hypothetical protein [Lentisphaeraceae bacterium]